MFLNFDRLSNDCGFLMLTAYNQWMQENGGSIVTIIVDMWKGWPGVR